MPDLNSDSPPLGRQRDWMRSYSPSASPWVTERVTPVGSEPPPWVTEQVKRQPPPKPQAEEPPEEADPAAIEHDYDPAAYSAHADAPETEPAANDAPEVEAAGAPRVALTVASSLSTSGRISAR